MTESAIDNLEDLLDFANGTKSRVVKRSLFLDALRNIQWSGCFSTFWAELVQQCKASVNQNLDLSSSLKVEELPSQEVLAFFHSNSYPCNDDIIRAASELEAIIHSIMYEFDKDKDGFIAGDEINWMAEVLSTRSSVAFSVQDILRQLDVDSDQKISLCDLTMAIIGPNHEDAQLPLIFPSRHERLVPPIFWPTEAVGLVPPAHDLFLIRVPPLVVDELVTAAIALAADPDLATVALDSRMAQRVAGAALEETRRFGEGLRERLGRTTGAAVVQGLDEALTRFPAYEVRSEGWRRDLS
jgi:hypothetical protein